MRHALMLSGALAAALTLAACGERNEVVEDGPVENASAESGVGSNAASNTVQDAASAAVGTVSAATLGRTTGGFVTNAAIGDMYEIESSRLALKQAQSPELKKYAQRMIDEHTKSSADLKAAVGSAQGVTIPTAMDERRQGMIDNLRQAPAGGFDEVYRAQQIAAHEENATLHRTYADAGDNAAVKALAAKHLPMIEQHLQQIQAMSGGKGGSQGNAASERSEG